MAGCSRMERRERRQGQREAGARWCSVGLGGIDGGRRVRVSEDGPHGGNESVSSWRRRALEGGPQPRGQAQRGQGRDWHIPRRPHGPQGVPRGEDSGLQAEGPKVPAR